MGERDQSSQKNPVETLAGLIRQARQAELYIEQQDIYPLESQRAVRILPAIKEDIERRKALLIGPEIEAAETMARLMSELPEEAVRDPQYPDTGQLPPREDLLEGLNKVATSDQSDKEE